ncbi:MAG TPA: ubiquinone biosynthesis protein [Nocardioidaceae bacterium]|nr:ubiquinone biosynthesis protein [Nocardioidaceae bacterium]
MPDTATFDELLAEGLAIDVEARWGAGFIDGRYVPGKPSWTWPQVARPYLANAESLLDMGTGEGGHLLTLGPLPPLTIAYEEWLPTVPAAVATLRPHGVHVVVCLGSDDNTSPRRTRPRLPFADGTFDVITNRHEAFDADDVRRLLRPHGAFVTQQVGGDEEASVRALLGLAPQTDDWTLAEAQAQLEAAGLAIVDGDEEWAATVFTDVAALVAYIRSVPWSIPEFDPAAMRDRLTALHEACVRDGRLEAVTHRFWTVGRRPY